MNNFEMKKKNVEIGVMQGRLLPRYKNRYQAFPADYWQAEFFIAQQMGFSDIEFILDYETLDKNPLMSDLGMKMLSTCIAESGVAVKSICADYFMARPFHSAAQKDSEEVLRRLILNACRLGVRDIVIPCVDQSSMKSEHDQSLVVESITRLLPIADESKVFINFETDLPPREFAQFLQKFGQQQIKVNYDIGNSASLGYDPKEEFSTYGAKISDLHIKDRLLGGGSVFLGTGNANFELVFSLLREYRFSGHITMQASRAADYIEDLHKLREQLFFSKTYVEKYLGDLI